MPLDPDDISLLATLAENPSLANTPEFAAALGDLRPQSRRLAKEIVRQSARPQRPARARTARKRVKASASAKHRSKAKAKRASVATKHAQSILTWARENRSKKK